MPRLFPLVICVYLYIFSTPEWAGNMSTKFFLIFFLFLGTTLFAQDIHFSQYYASPLNLNPANTGGFNGKFRLAANYRNQWMFLGSKSFVTYSGSFDAPVWKNKNNGDKLGAGLVIYNDKSGSGGLVNFSAMAGAAFHKTLDEYSQFTISVGVMAGIVQRRIDFSQLVFENQITGVGQGEPQTRSSFIYPDFTVGLLFRGNFTSKTSAYLGASAAHLHQPKETFTSVITDNNTLDPRFNITGGLDISIGEYLTLSPGFLYKLQSTAQEITLGSAFGYKLDNTNSFYLGLWYRALDTDALIVMAAYEFSSLRIGLSYDMNLSALKPASGGVGAVEVSIIYIIGEEAPRSYSKSTYCPKF